MPYSRRRRYDSDSSAEDSSTSSADSQTSNASMRARRARAAQHAFDRARREEEQRRMDRQLCLELDPGFTATSLSRRSSQSASDNSRDSASSPSSRVYRAQRQQDQPDHGSRRAAHRDSSTASSTSWESLSYSSEDERYQRRRRQRLEPMYALDRAAHRDSSTASSPSWESYSSEDERYEIYQRSRRQRLEAMYALDRLLNEFPRLEEQDNPILYERIAADDKRIYEQDGLLFMRTNPTADPKEVPLNYSSPYEVKLVAPGSNSQLTIQSVAVSDVQSGLFCVRYIEKYNRRAPSWLGELHHLNELRSKGIIPKPPRCGTATDESCYYTQEESPLADPSKHRRRRDEPLPLYVGYPPAYSSRRNSAASSRSGASRGRYTNKRAEIPTDPPPEYKRMRSKSRASRSRANSGSTRSAPHSNAAPLVAT